jgi:2-oxoisovalerate dehydrogenase E1 component
MPTYKTLRPMAPWRELRTTEKDWSAAHPDLLGGMLTSMHLVRAFEEQVLKLAAEGLVHGPAHSAIGQEGGAVGSALAMGAGDEISGSHRAHHQFLAKSLHHLAPDGLSPTGQISDAVHALSRRTMAEIMGLSEGFCRGRGGSMHLRWLEAGNLGTNAIVGGGAPMAAGAAWAHKQSGNGRVAFNYFGDGAINIGSILETMNLAAAWKLPLCLFVENNRYAVATAVEEVTAEVRLSSRGSAFGIPAWKIDGMDPMAVYLATQEAVEHMRAGGGPTLIEADCYRFFHQNGSLAGSAFGYRTKAEEARWRARDPLDRVALEMQQRQLIGVDAVEALRSRMVALMEEVAGELTEPAGGRRSIRPALWPSPEFRDVGVRGDLTEFSGARFEELETFRGAIEPDTKFIDVVADTMDRRMQLDERIVLLGEDIHRLKGGTNGATRGLKTRFPDRVLGTPISENAFVGLAGGMALDGRFRPVVEFMYPDFLWVAADQVFNQIGKARHMFGGDSAMPLVLRTKVAIGTGYGSQHSMDPAGIFSTSVGWRIVAPSTPFDYVGLMNSALRCEDPVLVIEHVELYNSKGPAPKDDFDFLIPLGKAKVVREGGRLTVLTYLNMVGHVTAVVDELRLDAEVIDLRSLDRAGLDWETIEASIRKTNNVCIVEQGALGTSYGGLLAEQIQLRCFDWLDQPVKRVHGGEASPSISKVLEAAACAGPSEITSMMHEMMADQGHPMR